MMTQENKYKLVFNVMMLHGVYYMLTGLWPLLHIRSFMWVTGPKTDIWLVKTVGLMICCIASGLIVSAVMRQFNYCVVVIALSGIISLTAVDLYYTMKGVILPVYLCDAVAEFVLLVLWGITLYKTCHSKQYA